SDRSAKSQNPQVYQVEINSCHKRQCRASGFVHEPSLNDATSRANGGQEKFGLSSDHQNDHYVPNLFQRRHRP
ncbi:hypothetical protein, partial [Halovulum sp. GXIMD14793]